MMATTDRTAETWVAAGLVGEVSELLTSFFDYEETLVAVARLAARSLADTCLIDVVEDGTIRRLAVAHSDPAPDLVAAELTEPTSGDGPGLSRVILDTGQSLIEPSAGATGLPENAGHDEAARLLRRMGANSLMGVPMISRNGPVGVMILISSRRFSRYDLALAENLARFAALELDNAHHYREARRALDARDRILGVVAHDLRNPLSTIIMSADLLRDLPLNRQQRQQHIEVILSSGRRMNRLIQDLLDVARIEYGQLPLDLGTQQPHELVLEAVALNTVHAAGRSLDLRAGTRDTLASISADRDRLLQVLSNLIDNAIKFTPEGGTIEVRAVPGDSCVNFVVVDTGPGIPEEDLTHVFETFWQKTRASIEGAGLGLAIARGIVEAHGGTIGVESVVGTGTTVSFTIPTSNPSVHGASASAEPADDRAHDVGVTGRRTAVRYSVHGRGSAG